MEKEIRKLLEKYPGDIPREELSSLIDFSTKINIAFRCDIHSTSRVLPNIKGRALYSFLMRKNGYTLKEIGFNLGLSYSTIINSTKTHHSFYTSNKKYKKITDEFDQ